MLLAFVQLKNVRELEAVIANLHGRPALHRLGQRFDGKANGLCAAIKAAIGHRPSAPQGLVI